MNSVRRFVNAVLRKPSSTSDSANVIGSNNIIEISQANILFQVLNVGEDDVKLSPTAYVRHLPWTIMIKLNEAEDGSKISMSVFVVCDCNLNSNWSCAAEISLTLLSSKSNKNYSMAFDHCFDRTNCLKGFEPFILWSELMDPQNGYMKNNKIVIDVAMKCEEPKCVPWNSKKHTNFVGMEDKTENSFLNSIIQILFTIESFRAAIDALSSEKVLQSAIRELKNIFQELSSSEVPVSIDQFIKWIGKTSHDSEYFFYFLFKLLRILPSTKQASDLFYGQISTLSTSTGKFEITELKKFYGWKLENCEDADIDELLNNYFVSDSCINVDSSSSLIEVSTMYRWFYGLIRWTNPVNSDYRTSVQFDKHIEITQLPSILILHLNRLQYRELFLDELPKQFKFCKNINLSKFVKKHVIDSSTKYVLHAVLVQREKIFSAFINVSTEIGWLKFDNAIVSHCTEKEAIEDNFRWVEMLVYMKCGKASSNNANDENASQFKCIICMEVATSADIFSTVCGHVFCGSCIKMEFSLRQKCPVCQNGLTEKDIHPLYI